LAVQNNTQNVLSATELLKLYKDQTSKTGAEVDTLGKTAGSAISYMNSAMNTVRQMLTPSGGGGSGCRTFGSGSYTTDGHSENYTSGGGPSGSPGMAWYNVLGNENASVVAAMGSSWASSVNTSSIVRNSCSGQVCSFEAGGQKFYGDGGGSYSSVNDALIKKDGSIVNFHPDDNILAFKEGSKLQGKSMVVNNTFNISGNGDPDKIADEILRRINRITRVGF